MQTNLFAYGERRGALRCAPLLFEGISFVSLEWILPPLSQPSSVLSSLRFLLPARSTFVVADVHLLILPVSIVFALAAGSCCGTNATFFYPNTSSLKLLGDTKRDLALLLFFFFCSFSLSRGCLPRKSHCCPHWGHLGWNDSLGIPRSFSPHFPARASGTCPLFHLPVVAPASRPVSHCCAADENSAITRGAALLC